MSKKEFYELTKESKLAPRIAQFFSMMEEARKYLLILIKDIDNTVLDFTPDDRSVETIGTLLLHIAAVEWDWILADIGEKEFSYDKWKDAFALRKGVNRPQIKGKDLSFYIEILEETRKEVLDKMCELSDEDLDRIVKPDDNKFTIEWILYHVIEHEALHIGQISLLKRLYKIKNK